MVTYIHTNCVERDARLKKSGPSFAFVDDMIGHHYHYKLQMCINTNNKELFSSFLSNWEMVIIIKLSRRILFWIIAEVDFNSSKVKKWTIYFFIWVVKIVWLMESWFEKYSMTMPMSRGDFRFLATLQNRRTNKTTWNYLWVHRFNPVIYYSYGTYGGKYQQIMVITTMER